MNGLDGTSLSGQFFGGILLGAVWSPCVGPTLGGAIALASQGQSFLWATLIMVSFAMGVSTIILSMGYGARKVILERQAMMRGIAAKARPILGLVFILVGCAILFRIHHMIEAWAVENLPVWLVDFSVSI